jgi:hypothetical protein
MSMLCRCSPNSLSNRIEHPRPDEAHFFLNQLLIWLFGARLAYLSCFDLIERGSPGRSIIPRKTSAMNEGRRTKTNSYADG